MQGRGQGEGANWQKWKGLSRLGKKNGEGRVKGGVVGEGGGQVEELMD